VGLYRRPSGIYWMTFTVDGKQRFESTGSHNKKIAQKAFAIRQAEIAEGRWNLPASNPPCLKEWGDQYLQSIRNPNTKSRYRFSLAEFLEFFGEEARLSDIASVRRIEEFKQKRLASGLKPSSVNRDLSVLHRLLTLAVRQRLIARNPFSDIEFLEERQSRRRPHILSLAEQAKLVAVAPPKLRALIFLLTETGLRVNKEALQLKWSDVDFQTSQLVVNESKTLAGCRIIPLSELCRSELLCWRKLSSLNSSEYVFPRQKTPSRPMRTMLKSWHRALSDAGFPKKMPIYNLRHTFASRLAAAGASPITVAQMLGHSSTGIVMTYAKSIDDARRDAIRKMEEFRLSHETTLSVSQNSQVLQ
jgi:integrase